MSKTLKINSIPCIAIKTTTFFPRKEKSSFALLGDKLSVIVEASGWSLRLAKKNCLKKYAIGASE